MQVVRKNNPFVNNHPPALVLPTTITRVFPDLTFGYQPQQLPKTYLDGKSASHIHCSTTAITNFVYSL